MNHDEIEIVNRLIRNKDQTASLVNFTKHSKNTNPPQTLPNLSYEPNITLSPKSDTDATRKDNYRKTFLTNINASYRIFRDLYEKTQFLSRGK